MEIVFFNLPHLSFNRGGEKWIKEVASYLSSRHRVTVITTDYMKFSDIDNLEFNYIILKFKRKVVFLNDIDEIKDYIRYSDVVYAFYGWAGTQRTITSASSRVIFGHHSNKDSLLQKIYYNFLEMNGQIKNSYHHFLTEYRANIYRKKGFRKIFIIPNFVDTNMYLPKDKNGNEFKVFAPGVTTKAKGLDILIDIARNLMNYSDIKFYVVGHKEGNLTMPPNVEYLGLLPPERIAQLVGEMNLMVLPTRTEAFSFSILENLSAGNPIVITDLPDLRSAFGESGAVYYAKKNSTLKFLDGILYYYKIWRNDLEKYLEISKEARGIALKFDSRLVLPKIENMLLEVVKASVQ